MIRLIFTVCALLVCTCTFAQSDQQAPKRNGQVYNPDGIELVYVAGSGSGIRAKKGFYIGKYEITQDEWEAVMGGNPSEFIGKRNPVECVSWNDIQIFLKKLNELTGRNYRLPTESEWFYAANGGSNNDTYIYAGSNNLNEVAWWGAYDDKGNSGERTHSVGTKKPNSIGIYDMTGNVCEWCSDCYDVTSSNSDCSRVIRGGSWNYVAQYCRLGYRDYGSPSYRNRSIGFRVVLP